MKLAHINASEDQLWRWFVFKDQEQTCDLELRLITTEDLKLVTDDGQDASGRQAIVAKKWFRGFRNVKDANGVDVPQTEEMRREILKDLDVWKFVQTKLTASANWRSEGKGDSDSAS